MKVLIVFTHPNPNSFNHALLEKTSAGLKQSGHEVRVKNLYQEKFNPVLDSDDLSQLHNDSIPNRIAAEQEQLLWADGLIFIYPLWWFTPPAMLKGWFDVVLSNGVAFEYSDKGATGLLKHKKALVMITAGASEDWFQQNNALEISYRPITDGTLAFCGVDNVSYEIYYDIVNRSDEERAEILQQAEAFGINFLNTDIVIDTNKANMNEAQNSNILNTDLLNYKVYPAEGSVAEGSATKKSTPLIILHGLLGSMDNWRGQAKRLSKNRTVVTMDLRNHGNSPHLSGMSYREMYEDVLALLRHLNIETFDCLGHSMGGKVAMQLALANIDQQDTPVLNKLIIVDIAPRSYPLWHQQTLETVMKAPVAEFDSREAVDDYLQNTIEDATERGFMIKNLRRANESDEPNTGFRWKCNIAEIARGYLKIAGFSTAGQTFNNKTLFISGGDSPYIREQDHSIINALFPNSTLITIENAGHLPHFQQADEFFERVDGFTIDFILLNTE